MSFARQRSSSPEHVDESVDRRRRVLVYGGFPHGWSTLVLSSFRGETRCFQTPRPPGSWWGPSLDEMLPSCGQKRDRPTPTWPSHQTGSRQVPGNGPEACAEEPANQGWMAPRGSPEGQALAARRPKNHLPSQPVPCGGRRTCGTTNHVSRNSKDTDF